MDGGWSHKSCWVLGRWTSEQGGGSTKKDNLHSFECVDVSGIRLS